MSHDRDRDYYRRGRWNDSSFFQIQQALAQQALLQRLGTVPLATMPMTAKSVYYADPAANVVQMQTVPTSTLMVQQDVAPVGVAGVIGFHSRNVDSDRTRRVYAQPEAAFQATRLFIPYRVAKDFEIVSIRAGGLCLLGEDSDDNGAIPAELFSDEIVGLNTLQFPVTLPGQRFEMRVRNISDNSRRFRAALIGTYYYG